MLDHVLGIEDCKTSSTWGLSRVVSHGVWDIVLLLPTCYQEEMGSYL